MPVSDRPHLVEVAFFSHSLLRHNDVWFQRCYLETFGERIIVESSIHFDREEDLIEKFLQSFLKAKSIQLLETKKERENRWKFNCIMDKEEL